MKTLMFLAFIALVVYGVNWYLRKAQAKADLERRKALKQKKKQRKEAISPEEVMVWPVIVKPVRGSGEAEKEAAEEPSMTTIEFKPPDKMAG